MARFNHISLSIILGIACVANTREINRGHAGSHLNSERPQARAIQAITTTISSTAKADSSGLKDLSQILEGLKNIPDDLSDVLQALRDDVSELKSGLDDLLDLLGLHGSTLR